MSSWQIFTDAGNNFRWESSGQVSQIGPPEDPIGVPVQPQSSDLRLPSLADLLLQGCSKLLGNGGEEIENNDAPMFKTGLGKSVVLKQSSIAKALSVLGDNDDDGNELGEGNSRGDQCSFSGSLFCTGSGKSVNVSSSGLFRARTLLGIEEDNQHFDFQGFQHSRGLSNASDMNRMRNVYSSEMKEGMKSSRSVDNDPSNMRQSFVSKTGLVEATVANGVGSVLQSKMHSSTPKPPPIKFQTAGGRSLCVSSDALERARSLLGDPDLGTFLSEEHVDPSVSGFRERPNDASSTKENGFCTAFTHPIAAKSKHVSKIFVSPLKSSSSRVRSSFNSDNIMSGSCLMKKFDSAVDESISGWKSNSTIIRESLNNMPCESDRVENICLTNGTGSRTCPVIRSLHKPLADISNTISFTNSKQANSEKRRLGRGTSISPFKKPRSSKFTTPLNKNVSLAPSGLSNVSSENSSSRRVVSTRYPFQIPRMYIKEYFGALIVDWRMLAHAMNHIKRIKSHNAIEYMFFDESGRDSFGAESFHDMLVQSGASTQYASKEWVANHYRWIVWKLACYERYQQVKFAPESAKFLTVSSVLQELKYRYEREVNYGHRSAIKRILEGDATPSSMLVLCISAIYGNCKPEIETHTEGLNGAESNNVAKMELTDGWYSVDAVLDESLSKHLAAGKLFVGQKLRIWGAGLRGWVGPVSPLEASSTVTMLLHINGTYRTHWADRLGLCKGIGAPLAFRCIKSNGGPVPWTLVGVTRIYPVLYKEKLIDGGSIVRSERMEANILQSYNQRRTAIVEDIASEFQRGVKGSHNFNDSDSEEGAKILKILETAAEPEVLMAEMSSEQLSSFASYQAKLEVTRQLDMEKTIQKALQDAGLGEREVTPFMRVRVVGLTKGKGTSKEGLITIWNPTEKQRSELIEGQAYSIAGLLPVNSDSRTLYLQARGSTTKWHLLSPLSIQHFQPFFSPRVSVSLSNLGEVPLSSEFDIAAFVVHVGEVYTEAQQKKQWVFVTDNSICISQSEEMPNSLLAISFCSPCIDDDSVSPINCNLAGSTVGFCNLIKRTKDQINHLWIAEATENSTYTFAFNSPNCSHLKTNATATQCWAKISSLIIDKLKEKVLFIIGDTED